MYTFKNKTWSLWATDGRGMASQNVQVQRKGSEKTHLCPYNVPAKMMGMCEHLI